VHNCGKMTKNSKLIQMDRGGMVAYISSGKTHGGRKFPKKEILMAYISIPKMIFT